MANNLVAGEQLIMGKTLNDNIPLFTDLFEVLHHLAPRPSPLTHTHL
jgi:hypothetical protein